MNITQAFDLLAAETEVMMENRYARHSYIDSTDWDDICFLRVHVNNGKLAGDGGEGIPEVLQ